MLKYYLFCHHFFSLSLDKKRAIKMIGNVIRLIQIEEMFSLFCLFNQRFRFLMSISIQQNKNGNPAKNRIINFQSQWIAGHRMHAPLNWRLYRFYCVVVNQQLQFTTYSKNRPNNNKNSMQCWNDHAANPIMIGW